MKFTKPVLIAAFGVAAGVNAFAPFPNNVLSPSFSTLPAARAAGTELSAGGVLDNLFAPSHSHKSSVAKAGEHTISIPGPDQISEGQVRALFYLWNDALATGDSRLVARRYASDAVLLPTVSDQPRTNYDDIKDYFDNFLKLKPQGVITDGNIKIGAGWAKDSGLYEFTMGADGSSVKARYSFLYTYDEGTKTWKIAHHHSSFMPESVTVGAKFIEDDETRLLFQLWNDALATEDPDAVASRYAKNAVLLPTVSDEPRTDYDGIREYFANFLKLKPQGTILESHVSSGPNWARDVGVYSFTMGKDGSKVKARYSFVYTYEDGQWKIAHHHSSAMPESTTATAASGEVISEDKVRSLFGLWNDALATLDPNAVANRYSKDAVLLPTVSDQPRTDYEGIKDYFVNFLQLKPQGTILESHVTTGPDWAKDVGVYSFKMGANGSEVKARYSFVYTFEEGEWKILHHHSSAMPESNAGQDISEDEVRELFHLWNDALATLDSDAVATRYSKHAVLLPTVSDDPRTDYDSIKEYFDNFLQKKPQGKILESHVTVGKDWCKDVGTYEFTMGIDGSKVKARYSFVYVWEEDEDGEGHWRISHHHSSMMPEPILASMEKPADKESKKEIDEPVVPHDPAVAMMRKLKARTEQARGTQATTMRQVNGGYVDSVYKR